MSDAPQHLARLAQKLSAAGAAGVARQLSAAARDVAISQGSEIPVCLRNSCGSCGSISVPGETSRVRIVPRRRRRRQAKDATGLEPKNILCVTCLVCGVHTRGPGSEPAQKPKPSKRRRPEPPPPLALATKKTPSANSGFISLSEPKRRRKSKPVEAPAPPKAKSSFQRFIHSVN
jgi:RNase P subunit RPR2